MELNRSLLTSVFGLSAGPFVTRVLFSPNTQHALFTCIQMHDTFVQISHRAVKDHMSITWTFHIWKIMALLSLISASSTPAPTYSGQKTSQLQWWPLLRLHTHWWELSRQSPTCVWNGSLSHCPRAAIKEQACTISYLTSAGVTPT